MTKKINYYTLFSDSIPPKMLQKSHWNLIIALLSRLAPMCVAAQRLSKIDDRQVRLGKAEIQPHQVRAIGRVLCDVTLADIDAVKELVGHPLWNAAKVGMEVLSVAKWFSRANGEVKVRG